MAPEMMNTEQAAEFLGLVKGTLHTYRSRAKGPPFHRIGGAIRYRRTDLEAWRDARRVDPSAEGRPEQHEQHEQHDERPAAVINPRVTVDPRAALTRRGRAVRGAAA